MIRRFLLLTICLLAWGGISFAQVGGTAGIGSFTGNFNLIGDTASQIQVPNWIVTNGIVGSTSLLSLAKPTFALTIKGSPGSTQYCYRVSAIDYQGNETDTAAETCIANGPNVMSTMPVNGVQITGTGVPLLTPAGYRVYGRTTGAEQFLSTAAQIKGVNVSVSGGTLSFLDTGAITPSGKVLLLNNTNVLQNWGLMTSSSSTPIIPGSFNGNWGNSAAHYGWTMDTLPGAATPFGAANRMGLTLQAITPGLTNSVQPYERDGELIWTMTKDNGTPSLLRGIVGLDTRAEISGNVLAGQAWALNPISIIDAGSDGYLIGGEFDMVNHGSDQAAVQTSTSKSTLQLVGFCAGCNPVTNAIDLSPANAHNMMFASTTSGPSNWRLIDILNGNGVPVLEVDGASGTIWNNSANIPGPVYNPNGTPFAGHAVKTFHETIGSVTLSSGAATVTFTAPSSFPNVTAICVCTAQGGTNPNCTLSNATTLTIAGGTGANIAEYMCMGS